MLASGKLLYQSPDDSPAAPRVPLGDDFSGILEGKRVMGICSSGSLSLQCKADRELIWEVPEHWNLEDAATVPIAYATVS